MAIDSSSSVSLDEFFLQTAGFASAFRDEFVIDAIQTTGGIAVAVVQWGGESQQQISLEWTEVATPEDALELADRIELSPRLIIRAGTAIAAAVEYSVSLFEQNAFQATRQVIDVSGDGKSNQGDEPERARDLAVELGITVNGLAILNEEPNLDAYFEDRVIGGPSAFVITANDYEGYAEAIRTKLLREIISVPVARGNGSPESVSAMHQIADQRASE